ncbi:carboxypeptidase regulatory-like domain-containing protein [Bacillus megaterium]|nr:carboxypeptidase regulatory-like domain-containing protein [Priestia megaterium]
MRVLDQNETVLGTAITDINGNYSVGNLSQGTLTIIASAQGFIPINGCHINTCANFTKCRYSVNSIGW